MPTSRLRRALAWLRDRRDGLRWTGSYLKRLDAHNEEAAKLRALEPWPDPDDLQARLLIAEGRLRHTQYEIQFLRSQLAELSGDEGERSR